LSTGFFLTKIVEDKKTCYLFLGLAKRKKKEAQPGAGEKKARRGIIIHLETTSKMEGRAFRY